MSEAHTIVLTKDDFLQTLDCKDIEKMLRGPRERDQLFALVSTYLTNNAHVETLKSLKTETASYELPMKVPGTALVVRLSQSTRDELTAMVGMAFFILGFNNIDPASITVAGLVAISTRLKALRAKYGERSVVEVMQELSKPTARNIASNLYGSKCRHPAANCRFRLEDGRHCGISIDEVIDTLQFLEGRKIVKPLNAGKEPEYGLVL